MELRHIASISGGKDSTALWLLAIERSVDVTPVFADTGHEHPQTYEYIDYLSDTLSPVTIVKADFSKRFAVRRKNLPDLWRKDGISEEKIQQALALLHPTGNPFLDVCLLKGRFPSTMRRFCSQEIKHLPIRQQVVEPLMDAGHLVVSWQGVRADESRARANYEIAEQPEEQLITYRPLITWSADDVFAMHRAHGVRWNPLYEQGMTRVGCMPCIHARKDEIREIAARFPAEVERVIEWERLVSSASKRGKTTFFAWDKIPGAKDLHDDNPCSLGFADVIDWSKTARGGIQFDLLRSAPEEGLCSSIYGLCE